MNITETYKHVDNISDNEKKNNNMIKVDNISNTNDLTSDNNTVINNVTS